MTDDGRRKMDYGRWTNATDDEERMIGDRAPNGSRECMDGDGSPTVMAGFG
jgi:hypothetical protein